MATLSTQSQSASSNQTNTSNSTQAIIESAYVLTWMPMHEPVTGTDGQTYEKSEITKVSTACYFTNDKATNDYR